MIMFTYLENSNDLGKDNEWYNWTLAKIKRDSIGTGSGYGDLGENSDFYALWRNADFYETKYLTYTKGNKTLTAYGYLKQLELQTTGASSTWENNQRRKALNSMKKMLALWESKRRIEIPLEIEAERLENIRLTEEQRLLDLSIKSQELESFYEIDESSKIESIPSIESVESIDSMPKQIPLETASPILLVLGIGLVSYYLLK